jgi:competence protein ComEA
MQKNKIVKICIIIIVFILCGCLYSCKDSGKNTVMLEDVSDSSEEKTDEAILSKEENSKDITSSSEAKTEKVASKIIYVYICGEVENPGVYQVMEGARMYEVVELAGGMLESGAQNYLNLAEAVVDGQKIIVPTEEEANQAEAEQLVKEEESSSKFVNLNTASEETLMTLPGIGTAKAKSIIAYREEKGGFQSVEQLMEIEGIKEGVYNKIKDLITVK